MPALITHYLFAKRVKKELNDNINLNSFFWGAQGPDFLLTHNFLNNKNVRSIKKSGMYLQDMKLEDLLNILDYYINNKDNSLIAKSYIKGFLCHYILDTNSFGFVSFESEILKDKIRNFSSLRAARNELKSSIDNIVLRYEEGKFPNELNFKNVIPNDKKVFDCIYKFYFYILRKNFDKTIKLSEIKDAFKTYRILVYLMNDKFFIKKPIVKFLEKLFKKDNYISGFIRDMIEPEYFDFANLSHSEWNWPINSNKFNCESFLDIYEDSIIDSKNQIKTLNF